MEYVKGVPLTEYCDRAKLSVKERLELFLTICQAVQHAHQKGIIHRDLKTMPPPSTKRSRLIIQLNLSKPFISPLLPEYSVYITSQGERILLGSERRLFEESLGMMVDRLSVGDGDLGVPAFDQLQLGQKLYALYQAGRALLVPDEPPPEITAFLEAAVATVYKHIFDMLIQEIDEPEFEQQPSWRQLVSEAARRSDSIDHVPPASSRNKGEWEIMVDCLADDVIRDRDFELQLHLDADPEKSRNVKRMMGISKNYYTAVPHDPPDDQLNLYIDALKGLTPGGRGKSFEQDDTELSGDERF